MMKGFMTWISMLLLMLWGAKAMAAADTVVIGGDVAEIVDALGHAGDLIGRDDTSLYPEQIARLPSVGYLRQLSTESILGLGAKRVLVSEAAQPKEVLAQLQSSGVDVVRISAGHSLESIEQKVRQVAAVMNATPESDRLIEKLEAQRKQIAALPRLDLHAIYIMSHGGSSMIAGKGSGAATALQLAGLSWMPGFKGYKPVGGEGLAALAPHTVLISNYGLESIGGEAALWRLPGMATTPAAQHHSLIRIDEIALLEFGPRTPGAILKLHKELSSIAQH